SRLDSYDPFRQKKFPMKRVILFSLLALIVVGFLVWILVTPGGLQEVVYVLVETAKVVAGKFMFRS
ncbi:MAG: hypothetical protein IJL80_09505, partial [Treponema sp.]|nr:hypothetical protein [Treponema sp.]